MAAGALAPAADPEVALFSGDEAVAALVVVEGCEALALPSWPQPLETASSGSINKPKQNVVRHFIDKFQFENIGGS